VAIARAFAIIGTRTLVTVQSMILPAWACAERIRSRLMDAVVAYLVQPLVRQGTAGAADPDAFSGLLCRGDVLLSEGNTRAAALVKRITRSSWSHVSMYVGPLEDRPDPLCVIEADIAAGVRPIRLSDLNALKVRVLRPTRLNAADRDRLAAWVIDRVGSEYDFAQAWRLARKLLRVPAGRRGGSSPTAAPQSATRYICGSLLVHAFDQVGTPIFASTGPSCTAPADHASITPGDFEHAPAFEVICP
jgi:hypothetical protein